MQREETDNPTSERGGDTRRMLSLVATLVAAALVVVLFVIYWLPGVRGDQGSEVSAAEFQMTAEAQEAAIRPTAEVSLSDLAPEASSTLAEGSGAPTTATSAEAPEGAPAPAADTCEVGCVQVGVALENFPGSFEAISAFGELGGRMPDMVMFFQAWGDEDGPFKDWLPKLDELGVTPLITWEPWRRDEFIDQSDLTMQAIIDGQHDDYIDAWAEASAEYGKPIYLRFAHEMNTPPGKVYWYPWQGDPEQYIAMWRHVHERFVAAGATNVQWVWSVAWMNDDAKLYYPGDAYVDWVAMTVLNFGDIKEDSSWRSFEELYSLQHERAVSYGKPVMISELASAEQGGNKGEWIAEIGDVLQRFPEIKAFVWLNYSEAREFEQIDWRVNSSPGALAGWRELMASPLLAK